MASEFEGTTSVIPSGPPECRVGAELSVIQGPDRGKRVRLSEAVAHIGTAKGATLELSDPTVSRLHCELTLLPDGVRLVDPGSTNGTIVDGRRVRDIDLGPDALICVGATTLRLDFTGAASYVELSQKTFESIYVQALLEKTRGNVTKAAELAGVSRRFFQRTMARNGIRSLRTGDRDDET